MKSDNSDNNLSSDNNPSCDTGNKTAISIKEFQWKRF